MTTRTEKPPSALVFCAGLIAGLIIVLLVLNGVKLFWPQQANDYNIPANSQPIKLIGKERLNALAYLKSPERDTMYDTIAVPTAQKLAGMLLKRGETPMFETGISGWGWLVTSTPDKGVQIDITVYFNPDGSVDFTKGFKDLYLKTDTGALEIASSMSDKWPWYPILIDNDYNRGAIRIVTAIDIDGGAYHDMLNKISGGATTYASSVADMKALDKSTLASLDSYMAVNFGANWK